jgi:hypothetical protein
MVAGELLHVWDFSAFGDWDWKGIHQRAQAQSRIRLPAPSPSPDLSPPSTGLSTGFDKLSQRRQKFRK